MPRTIEHIVENHRLAVERRSAGKPVWDRTINIKSILNEAPRSLSNEEAADIANRIGALLRQSVPSAWLDWESMALEEDLVEIVEGMETIKPDSYENDDDLTVTDDLNNMLDQLYDWADGKRVWLG